MAAAKLDLVVTMEDGAELTAAVDQRDYARWEVQEEAQLERIPALTRLRFLAFSALTRTQKLACSWPEFGQTCVNVEVAPEPDVPATRAARERRVGEAGTEDEQGLDPGRSGAPGEA